jgi:hypothetical protein
VSESIHEQIIRQFFARERNEAGDFWDQSMVRHAIDTLLAAERAAREAAEAVWRPIAEAPQDGTYILAANFGQEADEARWHDGSENHWGEAGWYYVDSDLLTSLPCKPDVWMPKPIAPTSIDTQGGGAHSDHSADVSNMVPRDIEQGGGGHDGRR